MRKVLLILSVMLLSLSAVFAAQEMSVTWEWLLDDPEVNYYRYQLNGTDDDGWTVVSGDTGLYVAEGLDPYQNYTLYLQRSYDGVNWSETASATAEALLVEEAPVTEEVVVEEPVEEVVIETPVEETTVEEVAPIEEPVAAPEEVAAPVTPIAPVAPVAAEPAAPFEFSLLFRPYVEMGFNWSNKDNVLAPIGVGGGISLDFDNIEAYTENVGFGIRLDVGSTQYAKDGFTNLVFESGKSKWAFWDWKWGEMFNLVDNYYHDLNATLLLTLDMRAGFADFSLGIGGGANLLFNAGSDAENYRAYETWGNDKLDLGAFAAANFGMKFYMGSVFSLGVDAVYKVYFPNYDYNGLAASLVLGFTF